MCQFLIFPLYNVVEKPFFNKIIFNYYCLFKKVCFVFTTQESIRYIFVDCFDVKEGRYTHKKIKKALCKYYKKLGKFLHKPLQRGILDHAIVMEKSNICKTKVINKL